jgi:phosphinothricin acetyltransferase
VSDVIVRLAQPGDLGAVNEIYNAYVENTAITFDVAPFTVEERRPWFERFAAQGRYRLIVAEQSEQVVGYAGTLPYRAKAAYETTVETTIYLREDAREKGLGKRLYEALFASLEGEDIHTVLAGITLPNPGSIRLHEGLGFTLTGTLPEVGRKFDRYWDVAWYARKL